MAQKSDSAKSVNCNPLREQLRIVRADIVDVEGDPNDPGVPETVKAAFQKRLTELKALQARLTTDLDSCEKIGRS